MRAFFNLSIDFCKIIPNDTAAIFKTAIASVAGINGMVGNVNLLVGYTIYLEGLQGFVQQIIRIAPFTGTAANR